MLCAIKFFLISFQEQHIDALDSKEIDTRLFELHSRNVNKINLSLWKDAYTVVQYLPNSAVFTTARTSVFYTDRL
jgi:hypothetical protein